MRKTKAKLFWELMDKNNLTQTIVALIEQQHHSCGMVIDFLNKRHPKVLKEIGAISSTTRTRILSEKSLQVSSEYLKQSQVWKLQYRFSEKEVRDQCVVGGKLTSQLRKNRSQPYSSPQTPAFWEAKGFTEIEAVTKATEFKRKNSPRCKEFWVERGFSEDMANLRIKIQAINGALASLRQSQKPKTEIMVAKCLEENGIVFATQMRLSNYELSDKRSVFVYDLHVPSKGTVIEVNGTYWHADPRVFKADDLVRYPGNRTFLAKEVWERDRVKRLSAIKAGYMVLTVWELDLKDEKWKQNLLTLLG